MPLIRNSSTTLLFAVLALLIASAGCGENSDLRKKAELKAMAIIGDAARDGPAIGIA